MSGNRSDIWPAKDTWLLREVDAGRSILEIAKQLGVADTTIRRRLWVLRPATYIPRVRPIAAVRNPDKPSDEVSIPIDFDDVRDTDPAPLPTKTTESDMTRLLLDRIESLARLTKRGVSLEEACDRMDLSPKRVRELVEEGKRLGFALDIEGPIIGRRPPEPVPEAKTLLVAAAGERRVFAQITDLHFGSRYHLNAQLVDFIDLAYARGVRTMLVTGDMLEGCYKHAEWQLTHHGYEDQANYFAEALPRRDGLTYHAITGNHDETFEDKAGMLICRSLPETFRAHGRTDFIMHGQRAARLVLKAHERERGLVVELWHPRGSGAYALSYKLQKKIESYSVGRKPDVLFCGHFHQSVYVNTRGIHAFQGGTFQGGDGPFGNSLAGSPCIGGWIVDYAQTEGGTVRRFAPEWIAYYEAERTRDVDF